MVDSSASSFSSSSSADDRRHSRKRRRRSDRKKHGRDDKHERHHKNNYNNELQPCIAAPSDWDELRRHYQFVLPTDDDYINDNITNNDTQTNTWQQRMVKNYHEHLYKEYVLADLSRVLDIGKIGLRWRTEKEVADGKGFRSCGNLMCKSSCKSDDGAPSTKTEHEDKEAYAAAVKRHMGIAVPENGGKEPLGVLLPWDDMNALDEYLQSCAQERREVEHHQQQKKHSHSHKQHKHKSKHKRKHKHDNKYKDEDDTTTSQFSSLKEQEQREQQRLSALPYDIGLHDYEVDFVYTEQQIKKRELVKVRLCLRCAPLLFVANSNNNDHDKGSSSSNKKKAPAVKAREAREKAARSHLVISRAT